MDEVEKYFSFFDTWRRTFRLEHRMQARYGRISIKILYEGRVIVTRDAEAENPDDQEEIDFIRQNTYQRAREDLTSWVGWMMDKYDIKLKRAI